jgi:hypothetical protein
MCICLCSDNNEITHLLSEENRSYSCFDCNNSFYVLAHAQNFSYKNTISLENLASRLINIKVLMVYKPSTSSCIVHCLLVVVLSELARSKCF